MNTAHKILAISSVLLMAACTKIDSLGTLDPKAVVQGYLAANQPIDIRVTKEIPFADSTTILQTADNLSINIQTDSLSFNLIPDTSGHYRSPNLVKEGKTYTMSFIYNGKTISATTTVPAKPKSYTTSTTDYKIPIFNYGSGVRPVFPEPIILNWNNDAKDYYLVVVNNTESVLNLIFTSRPGGLRRAFRQSPTQTNTQQISPQQFSYFGNHDVILCHVTGEYASLYNDTGNNSLNLQAPYSNVNNGLGIFTGFATDTLKLNVHQ